MLPTKERAEIEIKNHGQYCCHGKCNTHAQRLLKSDDIFFISFVQPCSIYKNNQIAKLNGKELPKHEVDDCAQCSKCLQWISLCKRGDTKLSSLDDVTKDTFICSLHFINPDRVLGPTKENPDPISDDLNTKPQKSEIHRGFKKRYCKEINASTTFITPQEQRRNDDSAATSQSESILISKKEISDSENPEDNNIPAITSKGECNNNARKKKYSLDFKRSAIEAAEKDGNRPTARRLGITESMIRDWRNKKSSLANVSDFSISTKFRTPGGGKKIQDQELDEKLAAEIRERREQRLPVSCEWIITRAKWLFDLKLRSGENRTKNFNASRGWLQKFLTRHKFTMKQHRKDNSVTTSQSESVSTGVDEIFDLENPEENNKPVTTSQSESISTFTDEVYNSENQEESNLEILLEIETETQTEFNMTLTSLTQHFAIFGWFSNCINNNCATFLKLSEEKLPMIEVNITDDSDTFKYSVTVLGRPLFPHNKTVATLKEFSNILEELSYKIVCTGIRVDKFPSDLGIEKPADWFFCKFDRSVHSKNCILIADLKCNLSADLSCCKNCSKLASKLIKTQTKEFSSKMACCNNRFLNNNSLQLKRKHVNLRLNSSRIAFKRQKEEMNKLINEEKKKIFKKSNFLSTENSDFPQLENSENVDFQDIFSQSSSSMSSDFEDDL